MTDEPKNNTLRVEQDERVTRAMQQVADARVTDEQAWLSMWVAVANTWNCQTADAATRWADKGLANFRERFPPRGT